MYCFGETGEELTKEGIFKAVRDEVLWRHYLGFDFEIGKTYKSPLRTDPSPSFSIFYASRLQKIMARDHGGTFRGDIIDYICASERIDFYSALVKINSDFKLGFIPKSTKIMPFREQVVRPGSVPRISIPKKVLSVVYESTHRPPLQSDIDYWMSYGISRDILTLYSVGFVSVLYCNGMCCYTYQVGDPCYEYPFPSGNRKYYRPFAIKADKFRGNITNNSDVQGYWQCRVKEDYEGKMLVLTKSMKDVMLLRQYDIDSMAIHGETQKFNTEFIRHLGRHYPRIVSLYDRDKSGVCGARYLWKEYGISPYFTPKGSAKDLTDLYKKDKMKADELVRKIKG